MISKTPNLQGNGCTIQYGGQGEFVFLHYGLNGDITCLWFGNHFGTQFKRALPGHSPLNPKFTKIVVAPICLYSDDTSGNKSKQYNIFDSYLMYLGATPLERRSRRENTMFIYAIVDDLSTLEKGIEVYSYDHQEHVLLVAPLLLFMADNPRQSQLSMHKGTSSKSPCRKCIHPKPVSLSSIIRMDPNTRQTYISHEYHPRSLALLVSVNGSQTFLRLKAFDPTLDCPVEVLHTIPLGCIKYLVDYLVKNVLSDTERDRLGEVISCCRNKDAYSRAFRNNFRHSGSFLGRDYKQLIQVLATILRKEFPDHSETMGQLCSLIYMRNVYNQFELYKNIFQYILKKITYALYSLDDHLKNEANPPMFSLKPKVHMLHHILEDIERFGCPLQYETESAEQFNKFIREHLFMTNRQFTSRDVAIRFGKQFICRQIFNGFSFVYVKEWKERNVWYEAVVRSETGIAIKALLTENPKFKKHFFGARANITDSYQILKFKVVPDLTGLFETVYGLILGRIKLNYEGELLLQKHELVQDVVGGSSLFQGLKVDANGNLHIKPAVLIPVQDDFRCREVMDFRFILNEEEDIRLKTLRNLVLSGPSFVTAKNSLIEFKARDQVGCYSRQLRQLIIILIICEIIENRNHNVYIFLNNTQKWIQSSNYELLLGIKLKHNQLMESETLMQRITEVLCSNLSSKDIPYYIQISFKFNW
ncbi:hypothetical protein BD770DRAFT_430772 [Pilaira anomala]|nr:hypothetical protein BD770DRAFT_430772 [Pilaira anomala]